MSSRRRGGHYFRWRADPVVGRAPARIRLGASPSRCFGCRCDPVPVRKAEASVNASSRQSSSSTIDSSSIRALAAATATGVRPTRAPDLVGDRGGDLLYRVLQLGGSHGTAEGSQVVERPRRGARDAAEPVTGGDNSLDGGAQAERLHAIVRTPAHAARTHASIDSSLASRPVR
jgi:hypothetical protein